MIGEAYSRTTTYIDKVVVSSTRPTVYNVVNELSDETSQYWSKTNVNEPKLEWEE